VKGFFALLRRDLRERRLAFQAAALAALIPFLVPLVRGLRGLEARDAREATAVFLAAAFAVALSAAFGWTILNRDLADRRLGFYLCRPLTETAVAGARLASALLLALGAAALVWLPQLPFGRGRTVLSDLPSWTPWAVVGGSMLLVLLFNAAGLLLRSRSALLAVDAAMALIATVLGLWAVERLRHHVAIVPSRRGLAAATVLVALGLAVGAFAAIQRGRIDIRAAHRAFSPWLWAGLAAAVAALQGCAFWVLSSRPGDLALSGADPAPRGTWVGVSGRARGAFAGFLLDTRSGAYRAAGSPWEIYDWYGWFPGSFSEDGRTAAWFESKGRQGPFELFTLELEDPRLRPRRVGYTAVERPESLVLSQDGTRFATISSGHVTLADLATGRLLASAQVAEEGRTVLGAFLDRERFRAYTWGGTRLEVSELDAARRTLRRLASIDGLMSPYAFAVDARGRRVVVREHSGTRVSLFDTQSGGRVAVLAEGPPQASSFSAFLSDGRAVLAAADSTGARVRVFSEEGALLRTIPLPDVPRILLGPEAAPGRIVIAGRPDNAFWEGAASYLVDADRGTVRKIADDLAPVSWSFLSVRPLPAGTEAGKLFYGPRRSLVRLDPETGERRVILEGKN
jgi:hypothetical protein